MTTLSLPVSRPRLLWRWRPSVQGIVTLVVVVSCGALVGYPIVYLVAESFNIGEAGTFPPEAVGLDNYVNLIDDSRIITNTVFVACIATVMAVVLGFLIAWTLTRTRLPGRARLERLMQLPYYLTPLVGALAWAILAAPKSGFLNQLWHLVGGSGDLFNIYSAWGIAWVMALFEGTVAFVMIGAAMKSMDPSLEETSRVLGAGKWRTMLKVTLPLVTPGVLGATLFVFAEMLGSFAAALVLGVPGRFFVITTAIWEATLSFPPDYGRASAMGFALFAVMFASLTGYRRIVRRGNYATITGKAFRPRPLEMGDYLVPVRAVLLLCAGLGRAAAGGADPDVVPALCHGVPVADRADPGQLPDRVRLWCGQQRARQQPPARGRR